MRRHFTPQQKAAVAFAALKGDITINQIAAEHEIHPTQVKQWRDAAKAIVPYAFADKRKATAKAADSQTRSTNYTGLLAFVTLSWNGLKKRSIVKWASSPFDTRITPPITAERFRGSDLAGLIEPSHSLLSVTRQAELLGLPRCTAYYRPVDNTDIRALLKRDMDAVDAVYTDYPFYGSRRMRLEVAERYGIELGRKRIRTVMKLLGLEAQYPKPNTSKSGIGAGYAVYPYLLRGIRAKYPNHVWGTDITYIRTGEGFVYLVAFIDWFSRYVLSWRLSDTLRNGFVLQALKDALCFVDDCGLNLPDIANSDQGSHFTSEAYTGILEQAGIQISMDGRGRYADNIFTERLWRTVKYEDVFPHGYQNLDEAAQGLEQYFRYYNNKRWHQSLDYQTPAEVYFGTRIDQ